MNEVKVEKEHKVVTQPTSRQLPVWFPWVAAGLAALLIALVAYAVGQRSSRMGVYMGASFNDSMMRGGYDNDRNFSGQSFRGRGMMNGSIGEVTAVSAAPCLKTRAAITIVVTSTRVGTPYSVGRGLINLPPVG